MLINDVAGYLHTLGLARYDPYGTTGNIFLHRLPDAPDVAIALYSSAGMPPDTAGVSRPGLQIMVRGDRDAATGYELAESVRMTLHNPLINTFAIGGEAIILCAARESEPVDLGPDENGRYEYSLNFQIILGGDI